MSEIADISTIGETLIFFQWLAGLGVDLFSPHNIKSDHDSQRLRFNDLHLFCVHTTAMHLECRQSTIDLF